MLGPGPALPLQIWGCGPGRICCSDIQLLTVPFLSFLSTTPEDCELPRVG